MTAEDWQRLEADPRVTIAANGSFIDDRHAETSEDYR